MSQGLRDLVRRSCDIPNGACSTLALWHGRIGWSPCPASLPHASLKVIDGRRVLGRCFAHKPRDDAAENGLGDLPSGGWMVCLVLAHLFVGDLPARCGSVGERRGADSGGIRSRHPVALMCAPGDQQEERSARPEDRDELTSCCHAEPPSVESGLWVRIGIQREDESYLQMHSKHEPRTPTDASHRCISNRTTPGPSPSHPANLAFPKYSKGAVTPPAIFLVFLTNT